jgi:hypothetical protein
MHRASSIDVDALLKSVDPPGNPEADATERRRTVD